MGRRQSVRELGAAKLTAASREFVKYRDVHCAFEASLGGRAAGNALDMRHLGCVLELNLVRAGQLGAMTANLPAK